MGHFNDIPKKKTAKGKGRTVFVVTQKVIKGTAPGGAGEEGGGGGIGIAVGQQVDGGGVVTGTTDTTVTIKFPNGVPDGPITLPGEKTTVVVEHVDPSGGQEQSGIFISPWSPEDPIQDPPVITGSDVTPDSTPPSKKKQTFILPKPGSVNNTVRLPKAFKALLCLTNSSTCDCGIYIGSLQKDDTVTNHIRLEKDTTLNAYTADKGSVAIVVSAGEDCSGSCNVVLTIEGHKE